MVSKQNLPPSYRITAEAHSTLLPTPTGPPDADALQESMNTNHSTSTQTLLLALVTFTLNAAHAGPPTHREPPASIKDPSAYDQLWSLATLFKDDANPFIQEFKLRGRYQGQYHWLDSDQGQEDGWEDRRSRLGFDAKLFDRTLELLLDAQSTDGFDPFYGGLVDAFAKWKPGERFALTLGRQKVQLGAYDFLQPSTLYPTFERSQIFNQLKVDRATGAVAETKLGAFTSQLGVYSNDIDDEFGQFAGGIASGAGIGVDLKSQLRLSQADWRFDYLHSEIESGSSTLNKFEHLFSTTLWLKQGRWSFVTEAFAGTGRSADVTGFFVLPTYDLIPKKLQLVARYTLAVGDGPESLGVQKRYESNAPSLTAAGKGDHYQAGYLGLQYFIYGDKLKLLTGLEYAQLTGGKGSGYDGWTSLTGIRFYF